MSSRRRNYTDDEVEAQTLDRLNDPNAWEPPVYVPPLIAPRPAWVGVDRHMELAARHYIVSLFHRLGAEANVTSAHPAGVDITVVLPSGLPLTIDVKILARTRKWVVERFTNRPHHYVAFVVFSQPRYPEVPPDVHLVRSDTLTAIVARHREDVLPLKTLKDTIKPPSQWEDLLREPAA